LSLDEAFLASMAVVAGGAVGAAVTYIALLTIFRSHWPRRTGMTARSVLGRFLIGGLAFLASWIVQSTVISFVLAMLLSRSLEDVLRGFLLQFDPCVGISAVAVSNISMSIALVKGFLAALIQTSAKYISARRETMFINVFNIGVGFGLMEAAFFSIYTYRSVAFGCPVYPVLNSLDLFMERVIGVLFHAIFMYFLIPDSKGRYIQIAKFVIVVVLHGLIDSGIVNYLIKLLLRGAH